MANANEVQCSSCGREMQPQIDRLELEWTGDGPHAREADFAGILADVFGCACGRVAIRPVRIELSRARSVAAAA